MIISKLLLWLYKQWYYWSLRSVNIELDGALMGLDMSHIAVMDIPSVLSQELKTYGLHHTSGGKLILTHLIEGSVSGGLVTYSSSHP
jgi:hypothetical protein